MRKTAIWLCLALLLCMPFPVAGEADPTSAPTPLPTAAPVVNDDFLIEPMLGYDGFLLLGRWMPSFVTVTNNGDDFEGLLCVNAFKTETEYDRFELPITLPHGATKQFTLPITTFQMQQDFYAFELVSGNATIAEARVKPTRLAAPETLTVGILSTEPKALSYMNIQQGAADTRRGERWVTVSLSPDTFPDSDLLMESFSMLVVDGVDARTLSEKQRETLLSWLARGGMVYVSGGTKAQASYPFFEPYTGLSAGTLKEVEDITEALLAYTEAKGSPAGETVWLSGLSKARALFSTEEGDGLVALSNVGDGLIFSAAFDLAGKPLSSWPRMASFWPRLLKQAALPSYDALLDRLDTIAYSSDGYRTTSIIGQIPIPNDESSIVVFLLLFLYLAVIGFAGYAVLKRLDLRQWLWGLVPLASVLFALIFMLIGRTSSLNKPVALTATRALYKDGAADMITHIGVAAEQGGEVSLSFGETIPSVVSSGYTVYSIADNASTRLIFRPLSLQQRFHYGENPTIGFAGSDAWHRRYLQQSRQESNFGQIDAHVWVEADGIHGEITNGTGQTLRDCLILSRVGFCMIDQLLPGERTQLEWIAQQNAAISGQTLEASAEPGVMYGTLGFDLASLSAGYSASDVYTFLYAAYAPEQPFNQNRDDLDLRRQLISLFEDTFQFYSNSPKFYFFALADGMNPGEIRVNGEVVRRRNDLAIVGMEMDFQPIGPSGHVLYPEGMIPLALMIDRGEDQLPAMPTVDEVADLPSTTNNNYLDISKTIAARFLLPEYGTYAIDQMTLSASSYDTPPEISLFDHTKGEWVQQARLSISMPGDKWAPYIDDDGAIYLRFVPSDLNRYSGMTMPTLTLKGEVK